MKKAQKIVCCLLVVPLFICLFACASVSTDELGFREKDDNNMLSFARWGYTGGYSTRLINEITLTGEEGSMFFCSTSTQDQKKEGGLHVDNRGPNGIPSATVESGASIFWWYRYYDEEGMHYPENDPIWLEFIKRKDSHILGYAVVRIDKIKECHYEPIVVKAVTFPKTNGKYQEVTKEQVQELMKNAEA